VVARLLLWLGYQALRDTFGTTTASWYANIALLCHPNQALPMLIRSVSTARSFLDALNESLKTIDPSARLSLAQKTTLVVIMMGIIVTGTLNWAAFERGTLKRNKPSQLRWIVYCAKIHWELLLQASVKKIVAHYGVTGGTLVIDDTDKKRSKNTTKIEGAHKIKDKSSYRTAHAIRELKRKSYRDMYDNRHLENRHHNFSPYIKDVSDKNRPSNNIEVEFD